ncbi:hypothetical protein RSAG8_11810, partial [Rhizoctonia solani AG-8 WAC10335]
MTARVQVEQFGTSRKVLTRLHYGTNWELDPRSNNPRIRLIRLVPSKSWGGLPECKAQ